MDAQKEISIKLKLETIKKEENQPCELRIRQLKSLINQMNLLLMKNPSHKKKILALQVLGYEAILYVLKIDNEKDTSDIQMQKERTLSLIQMVNEEINTLS